MEKKYQSNQIIQYLILKKDISYQIKKVAIEHNGIIIIPRTNYKKKFLKSNDKVEIVTFIGGG